MTTEITDDDAMNIGRSLMETLRTNRPDYSWSDSPTEIVGDLLNEIHDLKRSKLTLPPKGNIRVPLEPTANMLRAGTDVQATALDISLYSEPIIWDVLRRAWPVMVMKFAEESGLRAGIRDDVHELIAFLTGLAEADPTVMGALVNHRVHCNNAMLMHPTVQTGMTEEGGEVGMLGILNGWAGKFRDGRYEGWGPVAAVMEKDGRVTSFRFTEVPFAPPTQETVKDDRLPEDNDDPFVGSNVVTDSIADTSSDVAIPCQDPNCPAAAMPHTHSHQKVDITNFESDGVELVDGKDDIEVSKTS